MAYASVDLVVDNLDEFREWAQQVSVTANKLRGMLENPPSLRISTAMGAAVKSETHRFRAPAIGMTDGPCQALGCGRLSGSEVHNV